MRTIALFSLIAAACCPPGLADGEIIGPWQFAAPAHFPRFFSSDPKFDILLNDFFARHWFAIPGPSAYTGDQQMLWREWNALCTVWMNTSRFPVDGRDFNADLRDCLLKVQQDDQGYIFTYLPTSGYRDKIGWPFPTYENSGGRSRGWDWKGDAGTEGWKVIGGGTISPAANSLWGIILTEDEACVESPPVSIEAFHSPYIIITLEVRPTSGGAKLAWTTEKEPEWSEANSIKFNITESGMQTLYIPVYRMPGWRGVITRIRLYPSRLVGTESARVTLDRIHCAYDTRHVVNVTSFILGSWRYWLWTGDDDFLRMNIGRLRLAAHYLRDTLGGDRDGMVTIPYWGHDGTSGLGRPGYGIGSDYWDLLPMGHKSAYTNAYYIAALRAMADIEAYAEKRRSIFGPNPYQEDSASFQRLHKIIAEKCSRFFWDRRAGRFIGCEDATGERHDFGFIYLNLEALFYGLGTQAQAEEIYRWLDGERIIEEDTSTGKDIYHFRFAPRATTKRNTTWYVWVWSNPQSIPWGGQVQDGGTTAYISFYDVMNRIKYKGPDDAFKRLKEILTWYEEVQEAGGYRKYYADGKKGTLQGAGTPGGLGIDAEFVETTLVPLTFLYGFMGVNATADGLVIEPRLPKELQRAGVERLAYRGAEFTITCTPGKVHMKCTSNPEDATFSFGGRRMKGLFEREAELPASGQLVLRKL